MPITVSGTAITFNDATTRTTAFTGGAGTVTSVATGNGLQGGTITTSGTLSVACPSFNSVGSYCLIFTNVGGDLSVSAGSTVGAGGAIVSGSFGQTSGYPVGMGGGVGISGTWRIMSNSLNRNPANTGLTLACRVS